MLPVEKEIIEYLQSGTPSDDFNPRSNNTQWHRYCLIMDSFQEKYPQERDPLCNREGGAVSPPNLGTNFKSPEFPYM